MQGTVHIVGAGLAGLAAAVSLSGAGRAVVVHEATGHAGGRCRSYHDDAMGGVIDNGNHLLLSGNTAVREYLTAIGAADALTGPDSAEFAFVDLENGERWVLRPGAGCIPFWIFDSSRRVPGTRAGEYLRGLRFAFATATDTVADVVGRSGPLFRRFWEPMAIAVLNASVEEGAARLLWPVLRETFGRGAAACRPLIARDGLSAAFVDPALATLEKRGVTVRFSDRLRRIEHDRTRITALDFGNGPVSLAPGDSVVLAVPPTVAVDLIPEISVPEGSRAIVNAHFRLAAHAADVAFVGLVGGLAQWVFVRGDVASVTVSAADAVAEKPAADLAAALWSEVAKALNLQNSPLPAHRIVKEKRATFAQVPGNLARRPGPIGPWRNLFLAGDWTATGLPATVEGALRSGFRAARLAAAGRNA